MDNDYNKPGQKLIDVYRDRYGTNRWCYESSSKLIERLIQEVTREQIMNIIEEVVEEELMLKAEAKLAAEEDECWNAIKQEYT